MAVQPHRLSIFSQSLSAAAFVSYLLGAVVPLMALAFVAQYFVLPDLEDRNQALGLIALIVSVGALSLASFLLLRRLTLDALGRMSRDNESLEAILRAARSLSVATHREEAAQVLAASAQRLTRARAAFVVIRDKRDESKPLQRLAHAGEAGLFDAWEARIRSALGVELESGSVVGIDTGETPLDCIPLDLDPRTTGAIVLLGHREPPREPLAMLAMLGGVALHNAQLQDSQRNFFVQSTELLTLALDQHMDYHQGHSRAVAQISNRIGRKLGFSDSRMERLHFAALLHDIGMLRIPLSKHDDRRTMRTHSSLGHHILMSINAWEDVAPFVLHHHEWFDGSGYPEGLAGEAIPLESRIIGLAEAVDSMTSSTGYKAALSADDAVTQVREGAGSQFDPAVAEVFLELLADGALELETT